MAFLSCSSSQKVPYSFCLLRLVSKGLCVVIRLAFLGGTAGTERHKVSAQYYAFLHETFEVNFISFIKDKNTER